MFANPIKELTSFIPMDQFPVSTARGAKQVRVCGMPDDAVHVVSVPAGERRIVPAVHLNTTLRNWSQCVNEQKTNCSVRSPYSDGFVDAHGSESGAVTIPG